MSAVELLVGAVFVALLALMAFAVVSIIVASAWGMFARWRDGRRRDRARRR